MRMNMRQTVLASIVFRNVLIAAAALLTLAGFLSLPTYSQAAEQSQVQENKVAAKGNASDWSYDGFKETYDSAVRRAKTLQRQGYATKIVYDKIADVYEVWYR